MKKQKELYHLTKTEAEHICKLSDEPFLDYITNDDGKWNYSGLEIQIHTTSTLSGDINDSCIWIYKNGKIMLYRNDGNYGGSRYEEINALLITDYLRKQGYVFKKLKKY